LYVDVIFAFYCKYAIERKKEDKERCSSSFHSLMTPSTREKDGRNKERRQKDEDKHRIKTQTYLQQDRNIKTRTKTRTRKKE